MGGGGGAGEGGATNKVAVRQQTKPLHSGVLQNRSASISGKSKEVGLGVGGGGEGGDRDGGMGSGVEGGGDLASLIYSG